MTDREPIDITIGDLIAAVTEAVALLTRNKGKTNHLASYILRDLFARCRVRFKNLDALSRRQPIRYRSERKTNLAMKWLVKPSGEVVAVNKDAGALNEMKAHLATIR